MSMSEIGIELSFLPQEQPMKVYMKFRNPEMWVLYKHYDIHCMGFSADLTTQLTFNTTARIQTCSIEPIEVCTVSCLNFA